MNYNPEQQYRCTIIRGRVKTADDLLLAYANILRNICPCRKDLFAETFDRELQSILPANTRRKARDNHRTETCGQLLGMYYIDDNELVQISERTYKLLEDGDQPAFFKDICYKFQFPEGMGTAQKAKRESEMGINIRQCAYVLECMKIAARRRCILSVNEAAYYIVNSLDVLKREVAPEEVVVTIIDRRERGIENSVPGGSRGMQHIRETFNYMELANLIRIRERNLLLNERESRSIDFIASTWNNPLDFNVEDYDLDILQDRKDMRLKWMQYYSKLVDSGGSFNTTLEALTDNIEQLREQGYAVTEGIDTNAIGDEGEIFVYNYERSRVEQYNRRLRNRVLHLGRTRGLGYDIQSVFADNSERDEFAKYIEVKSTKRVTVPGNSGEAWTDTVNFTRNEWVAANQHRDAFAIYRVYFTPERVEIFVVDDPITKDEEGIISVIAEKYRVDFGNTSGGFIRYDQEDED